MPAVPLVDARVMMESRAPEIAEGTLARGREFYERLRGLVEELWEIRAEKPGLEYSIRRRKR